MTSVRHILAGLLGVGAVCAVSAASAQPLEEELSTLLAEHPQILAARKAVSSTEKEWDKAFADYLPSVSANADAGYEFIDNPTQRAEQDDGKAWFRTRNVAGLTVTQKLFDQSRPPAMRTAELNKLVSEATLISTRQSVLQEGIAAYIDVLRQRRLVGLAQQNSENIRRQMDLEDERVQRGSGITVDVLQAKQRLQIAQERLVAFEGQLKDAVSRYTQVFDREPDPADMVEPEPIESLVPGSLDEAIDIGLKENPAVSNSQGLVSVAGEKRNSVRSEYFPTVDLVGKSNYEKHKNATLGTRRDYSVLVEANWDLFTGFSTRAAMAQASFDYGASKDNHLYVTRKVVEQTKLAWQALETNRSRLGLLDNAVVIAQEVFDSRQKMREAGKETVINVLDAENDIYNAQINRTSALYDMKLAIYQLLLAMGRLEVKNLDTAMAK